jgi:hypothetical protein
MEDYHSHRTCSSRLDSVRHGPKSSAARDANRTVSQFAATMSAAPTRPGLGPPQPPALIVEKGAPMEATEKKKDASKPRFDTRNTKVNTKIPNSGAGRKADSQLPGSSALDRPKSSVSTRSTREGGTGANPRKRNEPKGAFSTVQKVSQSTNGGAEEIPRHPPKKVAVRKGGATQPTLSQLARMKAADEEKERRTVAKGPTKPLTIRPRQKAVPPKVTSKKVNMLAAAMTTPLPPSPEVRPADVPLPASPVPDRIALPSLNDAESNMVAAANEHSPVPTPAQVHPVQNFGALTVAKTPISALVSSIQRGFLLSPNSPLSPAQPDAEWECPAWPGLVLDVREGPSFEGVTESTVKRPAVLRSDAERKALADVNYSS